MTGGENRTHSLKAWCNDKLPACYCYNVLMCILYKKYWLQTLFKYDTWRKFYQYVLEYQN